MKAQDVKIGYLVRDGRRRAFVVISVLRVTTVSLGVTQVIIHCESNRSITATWNQEIDIVGV